MTGATPTPAGSVCPWWLCLAAETHLRRLFQKPERIVGPHVKPGDIVIDIGPGMGFFSIPMAGMAGPNGAVIAVDIQEKMLAALAHRARRAGVAERISTRLAAADSLGVTTPVDFALAFWMVHEVPDRPGLLRQVRALLKPDGRFLLVEPRLHVSERAFEETTRMALDAGLRVVDRPRLVLSRALLLARA